MGLDALHDLKISDEERASLEPFARFFDMDDNDARQGLGKKNGGLPKL